MRDVIVVGAGVIGLSVAHAIAAEGKSVLVLDPGDPRDAASWAAAGMLAPQSEAERPDDLFKLGVESRRLYRAWAERLHDESGIDPEYAEPGLLYLATSDEALASLKRRIGWQSATGFDSEVLSPAEISRMEPHLSLPIAGGIHISDESQVTPRLLLQSLNAACAALGVDIRKGERVCGVTMQNDRVRDVRTASESFSAGAVVIASGVGISEIAGLPLPVRVVPRKGQILSLVTNAPLFSRLIRWEHAYMVQRRGELVVGATNEDAGFDRSLTAKGIGGLLGQAQQMSTCTSSLSIREMWTGLRPVTRDGLPLIGCVNASGNGALIYATGHYRNGVLLAPITASIVAALVDNRMPPIPIDAFSPLRLEV